MITIRPANERGHAQYDWLDSWHTFSFDTYYDKRHMGFSSLRVINDDIVQPGKGFGTHPHRDMEIITYVLEGALEHRDSMAHSSVIRPGDVQRMSAGSGITHSEFNYSKVESVHLLQIWIQPDKKGVEPSYEQISFDREDELGKLRLIASADGKDGSVGINQDAAVLASILEPGNQISYDISPGRKVWLQVAVGTVLLGSHKLKPGDGVAFSEERLIKLEAFDESEFLLFDLA